MSTDKLYHYVYRITNTVKCKHYYGKRSSKIEPGLDLGIKYFSSSLDSDFKLDQKTNPQNYKYKIVSIHASASSALAKEVKLHNKFNVGINQKFYNKVKQTSTKFDCTGIVFSEEHKTKISIANKGRSISTEHKKKVSEARTGKPLSAEHKMKMSIARTGKVTSEETRLKLSASKIGVFVGIKSPKAKLAHIYDYLTNKLIIHAPVVISEWCKTNNYSPSNLAFTARANRDLPHCNKTNPHKHKGIYAVYLSSL